MCSPWHTCEVSPILENAMRSVGKNGTITVKDGKKKLQLQLFVSFSGFSQLQFTRLPVFIEYVSCGQCYRLLSEVRQPCRTMDSRTTHRFCCEYLIMGVLELSTKKLGAFKEKLLSLPFLSYQFSASFSNMFEQCTMKL